MNTCIIVGCDGLARQLAQYLQKTNRFSQVVFIDDPEKVSVKTSDLCRPAPQWIFDLSRLIVPPEYLDQTDNDFSTHLSRNICTLAEAMGCRNIFFAASIFNRSLPGIAKPFRDWQKSESGRRLVISHTGLIYGPRLDGDLEFFINDLRHGCRIVAGSTRHKIPCGYLYGFFESIDFILDCRQDVIQYEYVDKKPLGLSDLARGIKRHFDITSSVIFLPGWLTKLIGYGCRIFGKNCLIHRSSLGQSPSIPLTPEKLVELGFDFKYDFEYSLAHWEIVAPEDFGTLSVSRDKYRGIRLKRGPEITGSRALDSGNESVSAKKENVQG